MGVEFLVTAELLSESAALAPILAESFGLEGLTGKALSSAIFDNFKGKSKGEVRGIFKAATEPTHVEFLNPDDAKTSDTCQAVLRGKHIWPIGSSDIRVPPLHWNCRSALAFIKP